MTDGTSFASGPWAPAFDELRDELRRDVLELAMPVVWNAEQTNRFPRELITGLADRGHFRRRWAGSSPWGDLGVGVTLTRELAYATTFGALALGTSLHLESVTPMLRQLRPRVGGEDLYESAISGKRVFCLAASEPTSSSDLTLLQTTARPERDGWVISGRKKWISLSLTADFAIVFARTGGPAELSLFAVPRERYVVERVLEKHGTHALETCVLRFDDVWLPDEHLLGRRGLGIATFTHGMTCERLAASAMMIGLYQAAVEIVKSFLKRRASRDGSLWDHEALRHTIADAHADAEMLWRALLFTAWDLQRGGSSAREVAALKLAVATKCERGIADVMQLLGGTGYTDEFPSHMLRDVRLGRIGGGADQIMRNLVAATPTTDDAYDRWVAFRDKYIFDASTTGLAP